MTTLCTVSMALANHDTPFNALSDTKFETNADCVIALNVVRVTREVIFSSM